MSEDVNKDIQQAISGAQGGESGTNGSINISKPRILKHSLDFGDVSIPEPVYTKDGKGEQ